MKNTARAFAVASLGLAITLMSPALSNCQTSSQDQDAIQQVVSGMDQAWNQGDAGALAKYYTPDAVVIDVQGGIHGGRDAIARQNAILLGDMFYGSGLTQQLRNVNFLRPDVAVVDTDAQLYGYKSLPKAFTASGNVITVRARHIMTYANGKWRIVASQFTYVVPPQ